MTDKKILKIVRDFRSGMLEDRLPDMWCFALSSPLCSYLNFLGVDAVLVEVDADFPAISFSHWVLELPDGRIIDATGSQFNKYGSDFPEVYIGEMPKQYTKKSLITTP